MIWLNFEKGVEDLNFSDSSHLKVINKILKLYLKSILFYKNLEEWKMKMLIML